MTVSLQAELVFLLFSFLFGMGCACMNGTVRVIASLALTPSTEVMRRLPRPPRLFFASTKEEIKGKEGKKKKKEKTGPRKRKPFSFSLFLADIFFFLSFGIAYSIFLYAYHNGVFRLYSLLLVLFGFGFYRKTVAPGVKRLLSLCIPPLREGIRLLLSWLLFPCLFVLHLLFLFFRFLFSKIRVPFAYVCGILRQRKAEKKRRLALRMAEEAKRKRKASLRLLTARACTVATARKEPNEKRKFT